MKIQDKLHQEDGFAVRLYKEGAFWILGKPSGRAERLTSRALISSHKTLKAMNHLFDEFDQKEETE